MVQRTKTGSVMNLKTRDKIIDTLTNPEHEGKRQKELAVLLNITARTIQNYLTADVWQAIHERRLQVINKSLTLVDMAVYAKAIKGDMTAAKILYKRWEEAKEQDEYIEISEQKEEDIAEIKRLEQNIEELENVESSNVKKEKDQASSEKA